MIRESCGTCRFFFAGTTAAEPFQQAGGMCRRYAPTGPAVAPSGCSWQVFPPMSSHHWCGDYRPYSDAQVGAAKVAA